jgi:putative flippase GtrA
MAAMQQQRLSAAAPVPPEASVRVLLPRYAAVGVLSVAIDVGSLTLLHSVLGVDLIGSTTIAFALALSVNYTLNHVWAFDADGLLGRRVLRYAVLVAINFSLTIAIVSGLSALGVFYLLAKAVSVSITAVVNFTGYRLWVFR